MVKISRFTGHILFAAMVFACVLILPGCANHAAQKVRQSERQMEKEKKKKEKEFQNLKKQHYEMQTDETKKRMKASQKRSKKYHNQRVNKSFWEKLFGD
jgi:cell division protein FtsL